VQINPIRLDEQITHIALVGRMDMAGLQGNDIKFSGYLAARRKPSIVDLSELEFIASLGLGLFFSAANTLKRHQVKIVLLQPREMVEKAIRTVGLDQAVAITHSMDEALRILGLAA